MNDLKEGDICPHTPYGQCDPCFRDRMARETDPKLSGVEFRIPPYMSAKSYNHNENGIDASSAVKSDVAEMLRNDTEGVWERR